MDKSILVFGANGLVGRSIKNLIGPKHEFYGTYNKRKERDLLQVDITSKEDVKHVFEKITSDIVINCSNLAGGVNLCEKEPELAKKFHLISNQTIGKLCEENNSRMVMISTDYVFDGKNPPYSEDDKKNPLNMYGRVKLDAENWIIQNVTLHTIVRTTNVFGWDPKTVTPNYMMQLYRTLNEDKSFNAPSFLWGNPTYVDDLASSIIELCEKRKNGVFHVVGPSLINRFDWAVKSAEILGLNKDLIQKVDHIPENIVPRPLKSHLSTEKFKKCCTTKLHNVDEGLGLFVQKMKS